MPKKSKTTNKAKAVTFVATRYKNKKINVNFYTSNGKRVSFDSVKRMPTKKKISFRAKTK